MSNFMLVSRGDAADVIREIPPKGYTDEGIELIEKDDALIRLLDMKPVIERLVYCKDCFYNSDICDWEGWEECPCDHFSDKLGDNGYCSRGL